jgi:hypothetical protein
VLNGEVARAPEKKKRGWKLFGPGRRQGAAHDGDRPLADLFDCAFATLSR